ncbi:hypothetical protein BS17DRAFT_76783 [Gyrodon lividus]|nr:hypothetical protein BS17DRAFT_76783 [Gyrodon lividus]
MKYQYLVFFSPSTGLTQSLTILSGAFLVFSTLSLSSDMFSLSLSLKFPDAHFNESLLGNAFDSMQLPSSDPNNRGVMFPTVCPVVLTTSPSSQHQDTPQIEVPGSQASLSHLFQRRIAQGRISLAFEKRLRPSADIFNQLHERVVVSELWICSHHRRSRHPLL